ncbi:phage integrase N-terminal domain-containing protein [Saezia sanguinis]|uniref:phage integrase N-terminal domain-containing protein n=1 Tax=Saezia sanguinis TaxID=1965230 RepID=UPI001EF41C3D|nr:phage integrase N-terminal domain-containing protein [Saezia sanguinis]
MCHRSHDGAPNTQSDRLKILRLCASELIELGFRHMKATSLKPKHIEALVQTWKQQDLSAGTIKNRMAALRWWAEKVNRSSVIPKDNTTLGIEKRVYVTKNNKAKTLDGDKLSLVTDAHIQMSLKLQAAFGLRRKESIKFIVSDADKGDHIELKGSWTKGGKPRSIPVRTPAQRQLLDELHRFAGKGSLIPQEKSYIQQRHVYEGQCKQSGLSNMHGLRHQYAQERYEEFTGWKAPKAEGPAQKSLSTEERVIDQQARQTISRELGHERLEVVAVYVGT